MNLLISSAGRRVSLVRSFRSELTRLVGGQVFATDLNPALSPACQVADRHFTVPPVLGTGYIDLLLQICLDNQVSLLVPTIDTELLVLSENRERFSAIGTEVVVSDPPFIRICRDKRSTGEFLEQKGISRPSPINKTSPSFPLFIKPYDGSLSIDTFVVTKEEELTAYHRSNPRLIFMEYLDPAHHDEYTVDMFYDRNHRLVCAVPRHRIAVRAGEISKGMTVKGELLSFVHKKLAKIEGARGCLTAQFFRHRESGKIIGIEINPRFGGGYPLSYHAGANYPAWLIEDHLGCAARDYWDGWDEGLLMLRYDDEIIVRAAAN